MAHRAFSINRLYGKHSQPERESERKQTMSTRCHSLARNYGRWEKGSAARLPGHHPDAEARLFAETVMLLRIKELGRTLTCAIAELGSDPLPLGTVPPERASQSRLSNRRPQVGASRPPRGSTQP